MAALREEYRFVVHDLDCYVMQAVGITQFWQQGAASAFMALPNGALDLEACKTAVHGYYLGRETGKRAGRQEIAASLRNLIGAVCLDDFVALDARVDGLAERVG